jgi:hypothetical protein
MRSLHSRAYLGGIQGEFLLPVDEGIHLLTTAIQNSGRSVGWGEFVFRCRNSAVPNEV